MSEKRQPGQDDEDWLKGMALLEDKLHSRIDAALQVHWVHACNNLESSSMACGAEDKGSKEDKRSKE